MKKFIKYIFLIILTIVFLFPIVYMLACSFMGKAQISSLLDFSNGTYKNLKLIPVRFSLIQYYQVFFRRPEYLLKFWNSIIMTVPTVIGQVIISSLAAFAFALDNLGLLNNFLAVILPGTFSAFGICLLRQSMKYISGSSIEAARIDGASYFKVFLRIILPQIKGGLITLTLLCFIDNWNMVEQPLIYFDDKAMYPLSITMADVSSGDLGIVFACGVMFMIPALLIYLYGHRDIDSPFVNTNK